ncbi:uncharacterized protein DUF4345 [Humibacillus xanthopallidus]|uniref:Uncharacterized protein DUF4345 n=1 Tax=Humibacillus xanthopallidus TaxID=412689 RepID=A0A543PNF1_9MICO|nr:DUF4345 family protein [Humibacillus xanthopallidus]TQN45614.1 uncharacterized protein DUF4345 [Humibacillus xanthopallidus]
MHGAGSGDNAVERAASAVAYAVIGSVGLVAPRRVPQIFGADAPTADSRTEVRAVYGGIPLAMVAVIAAGRRDGLRAAAAASGGMALARATGMLVEPRSRTATTTGFLVLEAALAALLHRAAAKAAPGQVTGARR